MSTEDTMDRRVRKAVERILEDESLTSGLEDAAAKVLIDWGIAEVERRGQLAAQVSDADAQQAVDRAVDRARQVMKRVGKAADAQGITSPAELSKMLAITLSQVEAEDAAVAAPPPKAALPEPVPVPPAPAPAPKAAVPEPVPVQPARIMPPAPAPAPPVAPTPPKPEKIGFLARLRRFFGGR